MSKKKPKVKMAAELPHGTFTVIGGKKNEVAKLTGATRRWNNRVKKMAENPGRHIDEFIFIPSLKIAGEETKVREYLNSINEPRLMEEAIRSRDDPRFDDLLAGVDRTRVEKPDPDVTLKDLAGILDNLAVERKAQRSTPGVTRRSPGSKSPVRSPRGPRLNLREKFEKVRAQGNIPEDIKDVLDVSKINPDVGEAGGVIRKRPVSTRGKTYGSRSLPHIISNNLPSLNYVLNVLGFNQEDRDIVIREWMEAKAAGDARKSPKAGSPRGSPVIASPRVNIPPLNGSPRAGSPGGSPRLTRRVSPTISPSTRRTMFGAGPDSGAGPAPRSGSDSGTGHPVIPQMPRIS